MAHVSKKDTLNIRRSIARGCAIVLCLIIAGCVNTDHARSIDDSSSLQRTRKLHHFARICMGSRCTIVIESDSEPAAARAAGEAFAEIQRIESVLSDYRDDSESMRVMRLDPNEWHSVSETLFEVLKRSQDIHKRTHGAFDPTIGPLTHLWRLGDAPDRDEITRTRSRVGMSHVDLDENACAIRFNRGGMVLDFGGIGKGYAAQHAIETLRECGYPIASVDMGGDIALGDPPSDQQEGWRVVIVTGLSESRVEYLSRCSVATSGDLERFYEYEGVRYSHIIDPRTGYGLTERRAATVIAPDATVADALASAISVLGDTWREVVGDSYADARCELVTHSMREQ